MTGQKRRYNRAGVTGPALMVAGVTQIMGLFVIIGANDALWGSILLVLGLALMAVIVWYSRHS